MPDNLLTLIAWAVGLPCWALAAYIVARVCGMGDIDDIHHPEDL